MKRQPQMFDPPEIAQIIAEYQSGMTLTEVAEKHYTTHVTIINYLKRAGIDRRRKGCR